MTYMVSDSLLLCQAAVQADGVGESHARGDVYG